jgi:cell division protease FtsH
MFMGVGILKVKGLFRKLRKLAVRYGGVIVFFDEADSLGNRGAATAPPGWAPRAVGHERDALTACNGLAYLSPDSASMVFRSAMGSSERRGPVKDRVIMGGFGGSGGMGTLQALLTELSGLKKPRGFFNRVVRRALGMRPKPPPKYRILVMMATNMPQALDEALLRPGRIDRIYKVG